MSTSETTASDLQQIAVDRLTADLRKIDPTIRRALAPVRSVLTEAVMDDLIPHNPCDRVAIPKQAKTGRPQDERRAMTKAELKTFLMEVRAIDLERATEAARWSHDPTAHEGRKWDDLSEAERESAIVNDGEWELFFRLLAGTGLRWSEAIALTWGDLTLTGPSLELRVQRAYVRGKVKGPKSRHGLRTIPLSKSIARSLRDRRNPDPRLDGDLVFHSRTGDYLDHPNVRKRVLMKAAKAAGLDWIGFHTFRHTYASMLIADGRNLKQIQTVMGHHSAAFTLDTYGHLLDEGVGQAIDLEDELADVEVAETTGQDLSPLSK